MGLTVWTDGSAARGRIPGGGKGLTPKPSLLLKRNKLARSNIARIERVAQGRRVGRPQAQHRRGLFESFQACPWRAETANLKAVSSCDMSVTTGLTDLRRCIHDCSRCRYGAV